MNNESALKNNVLVNCFRASFSLFCIFFKETNARVFMVAHHWTQSVPDGKAPTDFKGNRVMPVLRALENIKMKTRKNDNLGHYYQGLLCIC